MGGISLDGFVEPTQVEHDQTTFTRSKWEEMCSSDHNNQIPLDEFSGTGSTTVEQDKGISTKRTKSIPVYGKPGIGKTTLANFRLQQWLEGKWEPDFSFFFLLDTAHFADAGTKEMTLMEMLTKHSKGTIGMKYPQFPLWMKNNAERIIIWFGKYNCFLTLVFYPTIGGGGGLQQGHESSRIRSLIIYL